jgi:hypothetical protein
MVLKSALLGLWLLGFGTMAFLYFAVYRNLPPNAAVSANLINSYTTHNAVWWTALAVCLAFGYAIVRWWTAPPILWTAALVTGLVPAGCLASFLALVAKLKHLSQGPL